MTAPTHTTPTTPRAPHPMRAGMTLMEIMIVLVLVAGLVVVSAYGLGMIGKSDVRGETVRVSGMVRYVYNAAVTQNRTLQLIVDIDEGVVTVDDLNISGPMSKDEMMGTSLASARDDDDDDDPFAKFRDDDEESGGERASTSRLDAEDEQFASLSRAKFEASVLTDEEGQLKEGVFFLGVMTGHHEELQTEGLATINFFPNGFVERSIIYIGDELARDGGEDPDEGTVYTIMINPLTGQSTIKPGWVPIEEKFFEPEEDD